ncbi:MAG: N-formylglutamate amidohydrolase [Planctomycetota bacterium]|jgi:formiminoglutamase
MAAESPLPILLAVPHAGLEIPEYLREYCLLSEEEIIADGDVGAAEVYDLADQVQSYLSTPIARAVLDMNRKAEDRRKDGVVKTHTCWDVKIWRQDLPAELLERVIQDHHLPYHAELTRRAADEGLLLGVDGHTMAAKGPPVGPDPGQERPLFCLGDGEGACPRDWAEDIRDALDAQLGRRGSVTINRPFTGGYTTRFHGREMPWLQIEVSREESMSAADKRRVILAALADWSSRV